jgi:glutamine---fructose-6-phosphate transaminase (isomerizing)
LDACNWIDNNKVFYFIARGMSLSSPHEAMLLWEEPAKQPASALTTGSFRHGPQEIVNDTINVGIWIDSTTRMNDIKLVNDLNKHGVNTLSIGTRLPEELRGHAIEIPAMPEFFFSVVNIIPVQIAS